MLVKVIFHKVLNFSAKKVHSELFGGFTPNFSENRPVSVRCECPPERGPL